MKIVVLGAGFTGLTAAYRLLKAGHQVILIEKEDKVGGLAVGFSQPGWDWTLERAYHHWFTNDHSSLNLASELGIKVITKRPKTDILVENQITQFDSPTSLLKFSALTLPERIRAGVILAYLKLTNNYHQFEDKKALSWLRKNMGQKITSLIWEPLFQGKFSRFKEEISLSWFWARIKKRTPSLAYPEGGFQKVADELASRIKNLGGEILLSTEVNKVSSKNGLVYISAEGVFPPNAVRRDEQGERIRGQRPQDTEGVDEQVSGDSDRGQVIIADKLISTLPSPIFAKVTLQLPKQYIEKITSIPHLHAQVLVLALNKPFMKDTYWLNITQLDWPFLVLAEHTNFMDPKKYGGQHLLYIGNYLPVDHPYLKMSAKDLLQVFDPYLKQLNPNYYLSLINSYLFLGPFAQPVVTTKYHNLIPNYESPLENIYLANMDMVYPWDRGTNYAIEMGDRIAQILCQKTSP